MDSLTHGLTAAVLAFALGHPELIPFAVAGSMIVDVDVLFSRIGDRSPERYLFTHGGIAHSLLGAAVMGALAWVIVAPVAGAGLFPPAISGAALPAAFVAALLGAYLHIGLDTLACPGLPLLAPRSDRKYTVGLLPGPSALLMVASVAILALMALGVVGWPGMILPYVAVIAAFLAVRLAAFGLVRATLHGAGRPIPTVSPLRWLVIGETPDAWTVGQYRFGRGMAEPAVYPKYRDTTADEVAPYLDRPGVRRVRFHSYITTAASDGDTLVIADPLRMSGAIFYPPHFKEVRVPMEDDRPLAGR
ncbi:MAG: metal-dependent hydrolase [Methanospirillum sp.]